MGALPRPASTMSRGLTRCAVWGLYLLAGGQGLLVPGDRLVGPSRLLVCGGEVVL